MAWLDLRNEIVSEFATLKDLAEFDAQRLIEQRVAKINARKKEQYDWCKSSKTCFHCGRAASPGVAPLCEFHREQEKERAKGRRKRPEVWQCVDAGVCFKCFSAIDRTGIVCRNCFDSGKRASHTVSLSRYRAKVASSGKCIVCATLTPAPGSKKCSDCRADVARYNTARHHELKSAGKCASCNKATDRPGKAYCSECTKVRRERWKSRYSKAAKDSRAAVNRTESCVLS